MSKRTKRAKKTRAPRISRMAELLAPYPDAPIEDILPKDGDNGSWVMLITSLPIAPELRPPKLSIHWTVSWPQRDYAEGQEKRNSPHTPGLVKDEYGDLFIDVLGFGFEPQWKNARRLLFSGESIRVLPHEFSIISMEHMQLYLLGDANDNIEAPYELVLSNTASDERIGQEIKSGRQRVLYEQALTDGCDHDLAVLTALGVDVTAQVDFPPIGWYRLKPGYAEALGVA